MNMDDVACVTALAAAVVSIAVGAVSVIGPKTKHSTSVAQECPRAHATSTHVAPPTYRAL
jgi:hypothetical protein